MSSSSSSSIMDQEDERKVRRRNSMDYPPLMSVSPSDLQRINLVVCGSDGSVKSSISDLILDQRSEFSADSRSMCVKREAEVCGRLITLVELPALYSSQLSEEEVMQETLRCVSLCDPGVHAFLFVLAEGRLTDEDKRELEKIQHIFSSRFTHHTITIIPAETQQEGAELDETTRTFTETCRGGYYTFGSVPDVSGLIDRVQQLLVENNGDPYTPLMFLNGQVETQLRRYKNEISENKKTIQTLEQKIQSFSGAPEMSLPHPEKDPAERRIVLLGRSGGGKSAAVNTILGEKRSTLNYSVRQCVVEEAVVAGRRVRVVDTPGLNYPEMSAEDLAVEIGRSIHLSSTGPHAFLYVHPIDVKFTQREEEVFDKVKQIFGEKMRTFTIILFTWGDWVEGESVDDVIKKRKSLSRLVEQCEGRYHMFNNKDLRNRQQVTDLLEKIDRMVERNSCYFDKMFEDATRWRRDKEERKMREKREKEMRLLETTLLKQKKVQTDEEHGQVMERMREKTERMGEEMERQKIFLKEKKEKQIDEEHRQVVERMREKTERMGEEMERQKIFLKEKKEKQIDEERRQLVERMRAEIERQKIFLKEKKEKQIDEEHRQAVERMREKTERMGVEMERQKIFLKEKKKKQTDEEHGQAVERMREKTERMGVEMERQKIFLKEKKKKKTDEEHGQAIERMGVTFERMGEETERTFLQEQEERKQRLEELGSETMERENRGTFERERYESSCSVS